MSPSTSPRHLEFVEVSFESELSKRCDPREVWDAGSRQQLHTVRHFPPHKSVASNLLESLPLATVYFVASGLGQTEIRAGKALGQGVGLGWVGSGERRSYTNSKK
ncbi:hypothetical protein BaRGS_00000211 [Batillaria attramentaria]|uniref:Uncharacterized protein n=1 Tax=Batillaria attramentaria TaxID=370345 RepID=A0ABD0MAK8_9CAEN